jgi:hypothetical protein
MTVRGLVAVMQSPGHGLPDFGAAIQAFKDEVDLRHAPMRLNVANHHRQNPYAAGADDRDCVSLDFVVMNVGWHVGSPLHNGSKVEFQPQENLPRMLSTQDQLLRTQREQQHNPAACGFPVTSGYVDWSCAAQFCSSKPR